MKTINNMAQQTITVQRGKVKKRISSDHLHSHEKQGFKLCAPDAPAPVEAKRTKKEKTAEHGNVDSPE